MKYVNHPVPKKDAMALVTGKPVYTDDLAPKDCLVVKLLRSPHPNAWVREIRTEAAKKVEGIVCVLTYQDVPDQRFTIAGQTYPEIGRNTALEDNGFYANIYPVDNVVVRAIGILKEENEND